MVSKTYWPGIDTLILICHNLGHSNKSRNLLGIFAKIGRSFIGRLMGIGQNSLKKIGLCLWTLPKGQEISKAILRKTPLPKKGQIKTIKAH